MMESVELTEVARALASPVRVQILDWLRDPQNTFASRRERDLSEAGACASLIAAKARVSQPTISRHLEILRRCGLVRSTRIGGFNYHRRDERTIARARRLFDDL